MKLNVKEVQISTHAQQRCIERVQLHNTKPKAVNNYIKNKLTKADYIGKVVGSDGKESEMFVSNQLCFYLSIDLSTVKTVIKIDNKVPFSPISNKVKELVHKEFRKLDRTEKAREKQLSLFECEAEVEISTLKLRMYKTKSQSVKFACQGRITALTNRLQELNNELEQIKTDKRQVAKALVTVI
jgi:hypothetical protein